MSHQRSAKHPATIRTYEDILNNRDDANLKRARIAIGRFITRYRIPLLEIQWRVDMFAAFEHFGTGRLWKERFTISRAKARRLAVRLRSDSADLRKALAPQFKVVIGLGPTSADAICDLVARTAVLIEGSLEETTNRDADWTFEPKRELTRFIVGAAGKPLDRELSDLISAILGLENYTAEEQRKFRERCGPLDDRSNPSPLRRKNRTRST